MIDENKTPKTGNYTFRDFNSLDRLVFVGGKFVVGDRPPKRSPYPPKSDTRAAEQKGLPKNITAGQGYLACKEGD
jgi:hypothetical protein